MKKGLRKGCSSQWPLWAGRQSKSALYGKAPGRAAGFLAALLFMALLPVTALANAAAPPDFTVLVYNAPADLKLSLSLPGSTEEDPFSLERLDQASRGWETYYRFFIHRLIDRGQPFPEDGQLTVTTGGESFTLVVPRESLRGYNSIYTLDLQTRAFTKGAPAWRTPVYTALRFLLTFLIEGVVFWLFRYRRRHSWLVFGITNLLTQAGLNFLLLASYSSIQDAYLEFLLFILLIAESVIFLVEAAVFGALIKEYKARRAVLCALLANTASLLLGGLILAFLPM